MTQALATKEDTAVLPKDQIDLIRRTVAAGASNDELALFLYDCQRRGVHPLDKLLHFTKRGGRYTPVTSIDFMRSQAAMSGEMAGSDDPVFQNDPNGRPDAATVTVYRITQGQRFAYTATARWSEYCPDNAPMWKRMPHTMLGKCAEALALRKAFPQQLAGLYSREEMDQADKPSGYVVEAPAPTGVREKPSGPSGGEDRATHVGVAHKQSTGERNPEVAGKRDVAQGNEPERASDRSDHDTPQPPAPSDNGPDMSIDMPAGARLVLRVNPPAFGAKGFVVLNAPVMGDEAEYPVYSDTLKAIAEEVCQTREPVFVECKQAVSSKKWRIESIMRVPANYNPDADVEGQREPPKDLPF